MTIAGGDGSGFISDRRLDSKPIGAIAAAYPKPVCPKCSFVIFNGADGEPISNKDLIKCREMVATDAYKKCAERSCYFLTAMLFEELKRDDWQIAQAYLKASWDEEHDEASSSEDLERCQLNLRRHVKASTARSNHWVSAQVLIGEISRMVGRFDESRKHFEQLKVTKEFKGDFYRAIVEFELRLIASKDQSHHTIKEIKIAN